MPKNSDPPTVAKGCRDINQMPISMEHPTVTCQGGDDYQPVQDLWAVNNAIIMLHPVFLIPTLS
jgi:hypothetical protein